MLSMVKRVHGVLIVAVAGLLAVGAPGAGASSTALAGAPTTFDATVVGGYGSGSYAPGTVVHVWSAASTVDEVVQPWSGDADLLADSAEWHSTFVMPARDVTLVANRKPSTMALTVEQYPGGSDRLKTVRYHFPPAMRGVVLMSHGTGGSSRFIDGTEAFPLALALVDAGYGVVSTEAEEVVAGDQNGDGKIRWRTNYSTQNIDLQNLDALFANFQGRGLIPAGTPRFALGMSAGGSVSHFLGTVSNSSVAASFPHLRFNAVLAYCADATATQSGSLSTTPSAWFMCGAEDNPEVSNPQARANEAKLRSRGIPTDYLEHPPSPIYDERFTRIDGISVATSRAMVDELRAAGFVGANGLLDTDGDAIAAAVAADPASFPVTSSQTGALREIRSQVKVMRAEHSMYADATARTISFFDRFVAPPSAPFGSWPGLVTRITVDLTGRAPTATDLASQAAALGTGSLTKGDLVAALRTGTDNTSNVDPVARLYRAFLGRTPDAGGLTYWVGRRRSGTWTLLRTADHFASSSEFIRRYGSLSNRQYVTRLYTDVLQRDPDRGGVDYWTRQLDLKRRSRGSVMVGFSESSEFTRKQAGNTDAAVAYVFLLGRAPSSAEVAEWVARQAGGDTTSDLADELLARDDYARHIIN